MDGRDNTEKISFGFEEKPFLSKCFTFRRKMKLQSNPFFFTFILVTSDSLKQKKCVEGGGLMHTQNVVLLSIE